MMSQFLFTSVGSQLIKISTLTPWPGAEDGPAQRTDNVNVTSVLAEAFHFSTQSGSFEPGQNKAALALHSTVRLVRIIKVSNVVDEQTGLKMPCVIVETERCPQGPGPQLTAAGDGISYHEIIIAFLSVQKWKFMVYGSVPLGYSLSKSSVNVFLTDGPTLCWERNNKKQRCLYYIARGHRPGSNGKEIRVTWLSERLWKPSNTLKWFGTINDDAVAMGMEERSEADGHPSRTLFDEPAHKWTAVRLPMHDTQPITDRGTIIRHEYSNIMPHEYSNIVTCIHFCTMSQWGGRSSRRTGVVWAATNQFQLVEFSGGVVRRVCNVPFDDSCRISVAMATGGEELFVVQSTIGKICAVWRKSFEVAAEWSGYHTVLVGDFLSCGSEQLLLLGDGEDAYKKRFLLTDLGSCNWMSEENGEMALSRTVSCTDNLLSAVQALEAQTQTGMAALRSSQQQYDRKEQLIHQAQDALHKMAVGQKSPMETPNISLTCVCDLTERDEDAVETKKTKHGTLRRLSSWQRVIGDQWVVGVEVCNQTDRNITDISASLIPIATNRTGLPSVATTICKFKSVACTVASTCTLSNSSGSSTSQQQRKVDEPMGKKLKSDPTKNSDGMAVLQPGLTTTVIAVTGIPDFQSGPIAKFDVMLKWSEFSPSTLAEGDNSRPASPLQTSRANRLQSCGPVGLHVSDLVTGKLEVKPLDATRSESRYSCDMQALDAIQLATSLIVTAKCSNLLCLDGLLRGPMGFQSLRGKELLCPHGLLSTMRVQVLPSEGLYKRRVVVHSRDQSDLLLFCQHLYQLLPDDVIIKPLPPVNQVEAAIATALKAIDKELAVTSKHLQKLSVSSPMLQGHGVRRGVSADENGLESWNAGIKLRKIRGDFEAERERLLNRDAPVEVATPDVAGTFRLEVLDLRNVTDASVSGLACVL